MDKLELLRHVFANDKFIELAGIKIDSINDEKAIVSADINDNHFNANKHLQGGFLYTLADFAFAAISNWLHPVTVTQVGHISYLVAGETDRVTAEARELARAGRNTVCEVIIRDNTGKIICISEFNGFIKETSFEDLAAKYGYKG